MVLDNWCEKLRLIYLLALSISSSKCVQILFVQHALSLTHILRGWSSPAEHMPCICQDNRVVFATVCLNNGLTVDDFTRNPFKPFDFFKLTRLPIFGRSTNLQPLTIGHTHGMFMATGNTFDLINLHDLWPTLVARRITKLPHLVLAPRIKLHFYLFRKYC
jgi:hypothetical protein